MNSDEHLRAALYCCELKNPSFLAPLSTATRGRGPFIYHEKTAGKQTKTVDIRRIENDCAATGLENWIAHGPSTRVPNPGDRAVIRPKQRLNNAALRVREVV